MTPNNYQQLAARTECNQHKAQIKMSSSLTPVRLNHAVIGLAGEVGELAGAVERWIHYGQEALDETNLFEELGDCLWYIALACNAMDFCLGEVMKANIRKLRERYPTKYTDYDATEENRDRDKEAVALRITAAQLDEARKNHAEDDGVNYESAGGTLSGPGIEFLEDMLSSHYGRKIYILNRPKS